MNLLVALVHTSTFRRRKNRPKLWPRNKIRLDWDAKSDKATRNSGCNFFLRVIQKSVAKATILSHCSVSPFFRGQSFKRISFARVSTRQAQQAVPWACLVDVEIRDAGLDQNFSTAQRSIAREEARARRLERESCGLAQRGFRALICSERALRTRILIEDAYEACVGPNETGHDALFMAHRLEGLYEQLSAELDQLPRQLVLQAERDGFRAEMRASHEADEAVRKVRLDWS